MNILWINNTTPPEADAKLGGDKELKKTGGWVLGMASQLIKMPDVKLSIGSASPLVTEMTIVKGETIDYYVIPLTDSVSSDIKNWRKVYDTVKPEVTHIHGSEYKHALTWILANGAENTVVSIQGLTSVYCEFFYEGLSQWDVIRNITPRDLIRGTIFQGKETFRKRGEYEKELFSKVNHIIGRTSWDKTHAWAMNPNAEYHFNNEVLRGNFYKGDIWEYEKCRKHSIFVNQAGVAYKGLHQLIKALPLILRHYPDTEVYVAGFNICDKSLKRRIMREGYGLYIMRLMKKMKVADKVHFTGPLNAEKMKEMMLNANVFVCPSAIENSPNALGEAQILGVPCVASRVGGVADMIPNDHCGRMYRFEETAELAKQICDAFDSSTSFDNSIMRQEAMKRHAPKANAETLLDIYNDIISS